MSKAVDDLMNEHEAILSSLQILELILAAMEKAPSADTKDIQDFIAFLKEFADKCHHGKEEGLLFPALMAAGVPEQGGAIGVLLSEHAGGRQLIREMEDFDLKSGRPWEALPIRQGIYNPSQRPHPEREPRFVSKGR